MAPPRKLALCGAVSAVAFTTLVLACVIFSPAPDAVDLLSSTPAHGKVAGPNFFATLAPGGPIHKLPAATGDSPLAKAEKKLSSFAYPRFPAFARSHNAGALAQKMSLKDIESTLKSDAADLLKDAGPSRAAISINTPRAAAIAINTRRAADIAASLPGKQVVASSALATPDAFPVGSPFPAKGARVIYIGGGAAVSDASEQPQQMRSGQPAMVYVGGDSAPSLSHALVDSQIPVSQEGAVGYNTLMPTESDVLRDTPSRSQRLGWDVNNPTAPDMQQWRPAYRQPPLGDVDHGDSIGANDENQDDTRFSRGFPRSSLQQELQRMRAREHADRQMILRLRGALQRVQEMSARAYTGAQAADVVLGSAAIRLREGAAE